VGAPASDPGALSNTGCDGETGVVTVAGVAELTCPAVGDSEAGDDTTAGAAWVSSGFGA
jgi:hypothetical protein